MTTSGPGRKPAGRPAAGPPDGVQALREEIEQTREHLGETVEQLVAKTDVKARAQDKAAELRKSVGTAVKEQLPDRVASAGAPVWQATPEPVRQAIAKAASTARQRRVPLAVAGGVLIAGYLAIRRWRRR